MIKMEHIGKLQTKEIEARKEYTETGDPKLLKTLLECLTKREELLFLNLVPISESVKHVE